MLKDFKSQQIVRKLLIYKNVIFKLLIFLMFLNRRFKQFFVAHL